jgi:hypothetical protein
MSPTNTFLAVFLASKTSPRRKAGDGLPEAERRAREQDGMATCKAWMETHQAAIAGSGGPLGKTKKVTRNAIEDASNEMSAFPVVRANAREAAARLFENRPHFAIFPGDAVEIMPIQGT